MMTGGTAEPRPRVSGSARRGSLFRSWRAEAQERSLLHRRLRAEVYGEFGLEDVRKNTSWCPAAPLVPNSRRRWQASKNASSNDDDQRSS